MKTEPVYVGIDVAKASLEVAVHQSADRWTVEYTDPAVATLVARLTALTPSLIVLEATGGLEVPLVGVLAAGGLPVVVVNPRQVRDFAKATGRLAKTDTLDAAVLAHFAAAVRPPVRPLPDAATQGLAALVTRLAERGFVLLDVQYVTPHLESLGAVEITRPEYELRLEQALSLPRRFI